MSCCHVHLHGCRIPGYRRPQKCNCISVFLNTFAFMLGSPTLMYRAMVVEPDQRLTNSLSLLVVRCSSSFVARCSKFADFHATDFRQLPLGGFAPSFPASQFSQFLRSWQFGSKTCFGRESERPSPTLGRKCGWSRGEARASSHTSYLSYSSTPYLLPLYSIPLTSHILPHTSHTLSAVAPITYSPLNLIEVCRGWECSNSDRVSIWQNLLNTKTKYTTVLNIALFRW